MLERSVFHDKFVECLNGDDNALVTWLTDPTHIARARVYRNNVVTAHADTILKNYPTVEKLVGMEFMRGVAVAYVRSALSKSPVLSLYGDKFPGFVETFEPTSNIPYLADVARLDRAWTESFFALNAPALVAKDLAGRSETDIGALRPGLHPSVRIARSEWNAYEIWKRNRGNTAHSPLHLKKGPTAAIIWWSPSGIADCQLSETECEFLDHIATGVSLGAAITEVAAGANKIEQELYAFFGRVLPRGIFASF